MFERETRRDLKAEVLMVGTDELLARRLRAFGGRAGSSQVRARVESPGAGSVGTSALVETKLGLSDGSEAAEPSRAMSGRGWYVEEDSLFCSTRSYADR